MLQEVPDDSDLDLSDIPSPLDRDLPCVKCGRNLRGLEITANCPHCGAPVRKTLAFALQRILCPACATPNHPSQPSCRNCGASLNSSARNANYFRAEAFAVRPARPQETRPGSRPPPAPSGISLGIIWVLCGLGLFIFIVAGASMLAEGDPLGILLLCFGLMFPLIVIFLTQKYLKRRNAFHARPRGEVRAPGRRPNPDDPRVIRSSLGFDADMQAVSDGAIVALHEWSDGTVLAMLREELEGPPESPNEPPPRSSHAVFRLAEPDEDGDLLYQVLRYAFFELREAVPAENESAVRTKYEELKRDAAAQVANEHDG